MALAVASLVEYFEKSAICFSRSLFSMAFFAKFDLGYQHQFSFFQNQ